MSVEIIPADTPVQESLIQYPLFFPIKVMGKNEPHFVHDIVREIRTLVPNFDATSVVLRASSKGNYLALTLSPWVENREQLDSIYRMLTAHPLVKYAL
jgi:hypothetical protein